MKTALIDVDGVVIDLFGGMVRHWNCHAHAGMPLLDADRPLIHDQLPSDLYDGLRRFMKLPQCYSLCDPLPGAVDGLYRLHRLGYEIVFNTSVMASSKGTYEWKFERLSELIADRFPFVYCTVPSMHKRLMHGDLAIDDRADVCLNYLRAGTNTVLCARRWSFGGCPETMTLAATEFAFDEAHEETGAGYFTMWDDEETRFIESSEILGGRDPTEFDTCEGQNFWEMLLDEMEAGTWSIL